MPHIITAYTTELEAERCPTFENDYIMSNYIKKEWQDWDGPSADGWKLKWFDYRHMTPLQATIAYMEAYGGVYKRIYAREFDREKAEFINPINIDGILAALRPGGQSDAKKVTKAKKQLIGCWRGRQIADRLTIPYDIYIDLAFTFRMRRWQQNNMPQPQQLYHMITVEKIAERWEELQASRLYLAEHSCYLVQNYQDLPQQNAYHEWIFTQAKKRQNPAEFLARMIEEHVLPLDKVRLRNDSDLPAFDMIERYLQ